MLSLHPILHQEWIEETFFSSIWDNLFIQNQFLRKEIIGGSECQTNPNSVELLNFREIKFPCISCNIAVVPWDEMIYPKHYRIMCGYVLNTVNQFLKDIYDKQMHCLYGIRETIPLQRDSAELQ